MVSRSVLIGLTSRRSHHHHQSGLPWSDQGKRKSPLPSCRGRQADAAGYGALARSCHRRCGNNRKSRQRYRGWCHNRRSGQALQQDRQHRQYHRAMAAARPARALPYHHLKPRSVRILCWREVSILTRGQLFDPRRIKGNLPLPVSPRPHGVISMLTATCIKHQRAT